MFDIFSHITWQTGSLHTSESFSRSTFSLVGIMILLTLALVTRQWLRLELRPL